MFKEATSEIPSAVMKLTPPAVTIFGGWTADHVIALLTIVYLLGLGVHQLLKLYWAVQDRRASRRGG